MICSAQQAECSSCMTGLNSAILNEQHVQAAPPPEEHVITVAWMVRQTVSGSAPLFGQTPCSAPLGV